MTPFDTPGSLETILSTLLIPILVVVAGVIIERLVSKWMRKSIKT
jgi:hypothetical protein